MEKRKACADDFKFLLKIFLKILAISYFQTVWAKGMFVLFLFVQHRLYKLVNKIHALSVF